MAYPVSAYFGRDTYAILSHCVYCGKPYNEAERWNTLATSGAKADAWYIACDECFRMRVYESRGDA